MIALRVAGCVGIGLAAAGPVAAQEVVDHSAATTVQSTVVIDKTVVKSGRTDTAESGLTVNGRIETGAERARRDAVDLREVGTAVGTNHVQETATRTTVVVKGAVTQEGNRRSQACTQVGVIGAQNECRPHAP